MKKTYIKPEIELTNILTESHILSVSSVDIYTETNNVVDRSNEYDFADIDLWADDESAEW